MRRILLVGDDRRTRLAIGIWLKQCGLRVAITDGGESGLAALHDGMFDQMIVDVFMPNMRAFEPIRVFHSRAPTVPLIAISGYAFSAPGTDDPTCFKRALSLGATRCLRKGNHWHLRQIREPGSPLRLRLRNDWVEVHYLLPGAGMTRVLIVDDDPLVCAAIKICLERHGFDVTIADGGEAGLRALEDAGFDLMLVDIFMPHMRGFESIRIFHERAPTVPLIAMSGYAFAKLDSPAPDFLRMALELGAARCLRKPFTPEALLTVVNECLAEARSRFSGVVQSN